jgi:hypothetical protein
MAKITAKPKKTPEEEEQELQALMSGVHITQGAGMTANGVKAEATTTSTNEGEQKGEKAAATPAVAISEASRTETPSSEQVTETPTPTPVPEPPLPTAPAPPPTVAVDKTPKKPALVEQPPAPPTTPSVEPPSVVDTEADVTNEPDSASSTQGAPFDLGSLFTPVPEKKPRICRISDRHYDYLLTLGMFVGNRTPPPDIVYNLIEQLIATHDKEIQKVITRQMRAARNKKS